jgi:hypothetical protein
MRQAIKRHRVRCSIRAACPELNRAAGGVDRDRLIRENERVGPLYVSLAIGAILMAMLIYILVSDELVVRALARRPKRGEPSTRRFSALNPSRLVARRGR